MKKKDYSLDALMRRVIRMYADDTNEGVLRIVYATGGTETLDKRVMPAFASVIDEPRGAIRVEVAEDYISMEGSPVYFGSQDNFKLFCDTDGLMKLHAVDINGNYEPVYEWSSPIQLTTPVGTSPLRLYNAGLYLGQYCLWKLSCHNAHLDVQVKEGASYVHLEYIGAAGLGDEQVPVVGNGVQLGDASIRFGVDGFYRLYCDAVTGKLTLARKFDPDTDQLVVMQEWGA